MDILLINPPDKIKTSAFQHLLKSSMNMMPLGLLYLGTVLKAGGYDVRVVDFNACDHEEEKSIFEELSTSPPQIIGITTTTTSYNNARAVIRRIKSETACNAMVVWGGPHVTFLPDECLEEGLGQIVVRGEGEDAMTAIADSVINKQNKDCIRKIKGVSCMQDGEIIHNPPGILRLGNLDQLPMLDRDLLDITRYNNPSTILSSRGCSGECLFCSSSSWGGIVCRDPQNIAGEIEFLNRKYGFKRIAFVDNIFITNKEYTIALLKSLKKFSVDISFSAEININLLDPELIELLGEINLSSVQFGIESGNQQIQEQIHKNIDLDDVPRKIELCLKNKIRTVCSFLIGHPGDTRDTVEDTISFARKIKKTGSQVCISIITPYPGSSIFNFRDKMGIKITDWNFDNWGDPGVPVFKTINLTVKDLRQLYQKAISGLNSF